MEIIAKRKITIKLTIIITTLFFTAMSILFTWIFLKEFQRGNSKSFLLIIFSIGTMILWFYLTKKYIHLSSKIIANRNSIKIRKAEHNWENLKSIKTSSHYELFGYKFEGTILIFDDNSHVPILDKFRTNTPELRHFINEVIIKKRKYSGIDSKKEIKYHQINESFNKFKGNPVLSFRGVMLWGLILFCTGLIILNPKKFPLLLFIIIGWFISNSLQMYYFEVSENYLLIKNHYFFWIKKVIELDSVKKIYIEEQRKQAIGLRIVSINFEIFFFRAGTLNDKTWLNLKNELNKRRIKVVNNIIPE